MTVYLDHAATAPILPEVVDAVAHELACWANPSSLHRDGRRAQAALEAARQRVARALEWDGEVLFTSGATEALAIAWDRSKTASKMASAVEHPALMRHAGDALIPVDADGLVDPARLPIADLVAVMQVNNETGVIQPLDRIAEQVRKTGGLLLADCAQGAGKLPLPQADFCVIAGHKIGAPPGVGALLVRDLGTLTASGGQERGYRGGTENLPHIVGLATALEASREWVARAKELRDWFEDEMTALGAHAIAASAPRVPTIGAYRLPGLSAQVLLIRCDSAGIAISAGSACSSGSLKPSHVLLAMGMDERTTREVFRVSIGRDTSRSDLEQLLRVVAEAGVSRAAA